eukprot:scaffold2349_cov140-Skeletonema_menzelii.AAC.13
MAFGVALAGGDEKTCAHLHPVRPIGGTSASAFFWRCPRQKCRDSGKRCSCDLDTILPHSAVPERPKPKA